MKTLLSLTALCIAVALTGCQTADSMDASPGAVTECPVDCTGACCMKKCGPDCTKPCCADAGLGAISDDAAPTCPYSSGKKTDANMGALSTPSCCSGRDSQVNALTTRPSRNEIAPSPSTVWIVRKPVFWLNETI